MTSNEHLINLKISHMGQSKNHFMETREQEIHAEKVDLQAMLRSMLFLPTMTGNADFVDYLTKINCNETGSIQPGHKACDK